MHLRPEHKVGWNSYSVNTTPTTTPLPYDAPAPTTFIQNGWQCPKCGRINAPWVETCPCYTDNIKIVCNCGDKKTN